MRRSFASCFVLAALALLSWAEPAQAQWTEDTVVVLKGNVVTMTGAVARAQIVIRKGKIEAIKPVGAVAPVGAIVIETRGFIYPGLMNLHDHMEYNFVPLYTVPKHYDNHDQWPGGKAYDTGVNNPWKIATDPNLFGRSDEAFKFAEVRSIIGGSTTTQGADNCPAISHSLVRNVELENFGVDNIGQRSLTIDKLFWTHLPEMIDRIKAQQAWIVHTCEGIDAYSRAEWTNPTWNASQPFNAHNRPGLVEAGLVWPGLVGVHCTAMTEADYRQWKQITGGPPKIVWSPTSNLLLYGQTTDVAAALRVGALIAIGTDWAPSGTRNLLWELKTVDQVNKTRLHNLLTERQIVELATVNPARMVGWQDKVGTLKAGMYADLVVIDDRHAPNAYRNLIDAVEQNVQLVFVGGNPLYGDEVHMRRLKTYNNAPRYEVLPETAGARPKAIDMQENPTARKGTETLAQVRASLTEAISADPAALAAAVNVGVQETSTRHTYEAREYVKSQLVTLLTRANKPVDAALRDPNSALTAAQAADFIKLKYPNLNPAANHLESLYTDAAWVDALGTNLHWAAPYSAGVDLHAYLPHGTTPPPSGPTTGITGAVPH
jgi:5-methylthioadenosine/S-adenosylhomocysteine deaminase